MRGVTDNDPELGRAFWRTQGIAWGCLALFGFCSRLVVFRNVTAAFVCTVVVDGLGFVLTSLLARQSFTRIHFGHSMSPRALLLCALWILGIATLMGFVAYQVRMDFSTIGVDTIRGNEYIIGFIYHLSVITGWTLAYLGIRAGLEARSQRMQALANETRALRLEVESLQLQIEPHFLFNALNTIVSEIGDRPAVAEEMTRQLAAYLRYSLQRRDQHAGSVADELEAVAMYFRIQALRFDERFSYTCNADTHAMSARIPHMAIQCLVENAIKHGLKSDHVGFQINVRVTRTDDTLRVEVDNPSAPEAPGTPTRTGTGLANLRRRCELRYPDRYAFSLNQRDGRTVATLSLRGDPCCV